MIKSPQVLEQHALASPFVLPSLAMPEQSGEMVSSAIGSELSPSTETLQNVVADTTSSFDEVPFSAPQESVTQFDQKDLEHLEQLREEARQEGFKQGYAEARDLVNDEYAELLEVLRRLIQSGEKSLNQGLENNHDLMVSIIYEAVCKIIGDRLVTIEGCNALLTHALRDIQFEDLIAIKVSAGDLARIKKADPSIQTAFAGLPIEADASVESGGCVLRLRDGLVDARIETQMTQLAESLREIAKHNDI